MGKSFFDCILEVMPNYEWVSSREISERLLTMLGIRLSNSRISGIIRAHSSTLIETKRIKANMVMHRKKQTSIVY